MLFPIFTSSGLTVSAADRASAFNFCNPFDDVLPIVDSSVSNLDRAHLWGLYSGIEIGAGGGDVTVTCVTDALTLTEGLANVTVDIAVDCTTDALTLTEGTASVTIDIDVDCTTDALTLVTGTASIEADTVVNCATHALNLTTNVCDIEVGGSKGGVPVKKKQDDYNKALKESLRRRERQAIIEAVEAEIEPTKRKKLTLKKIPLPVSSEVVEQIASIELDTDRELAIEFQLNQLEFKRREEEALFLLLLVA